MSWPFQVGFADFDEVNFPNQSMRDEHFELLGTFREGGVGVRIWKALVFDTERDDTPGVYHEIEIVKTGEDALRFGLDEFSNLIAALKRAVEVIKKDLDRTTTDSIVEMLGALRAASS